MKFRADPTNEQSSFFEIEKNKVRVLGPANQHTVFNHSETLPKAGIYYFKFKILRSPVKEIMAGICGKNIKSQINQAAYQSHYFMALRYKDGYYYSKKPLSTGAEITFTEDAVLEV